MALIPSGINWAGVDVNEIIQKVFAETYFHKNFGAKIFSAIKGKMVYHELSDDMTLETYGACPTSAGGDFTLTQRERSVCEFMMTGEFDHKSLVNTYLQNQYPSGGFRNEKINETALFAMIVERAIKRAQDQWDDIILNGDTVYGSTHLALCDGLFAQWTSDANVVNLTSVPGNITASAVAGELNKVINAIPSELRYSSDPAKRMKIGTSIKIASTYEQYLTQTGNGFNFYDPTQAGVMKFNGFEIVPLNYVPDDVMFATPADNVKLYYDDEGDFATFNITDLSLSDAFCDRVRMKLKARGGVDYNYGEYVVYYH